MAFKAAVLVGGPQKGALHLRVETAPRAVVSPSEYDRRRRSPDLPLRPLSRPARSPHGVGRAKQSPPLLNGFVFYTLSLSLACSNN